MTDAIPPEPAQSVAEIIHTRRNERPFFSDTGLPEPTNEYICWIDVMGSQSIMMRSVRIASNFLMKLHIAALRASETYPVELYPVIDGVYVCSPTQSNILHFVNRVNSALALTFILENNALHRFEIRSGLAYGPVVKGRDALGCADELRNNPEHAEQVLLGPPLTQAYETEKQAAPFGVALHESVRCFASEGEVAMSGTYWQWWKSHCQATDDVIASELYRCLSAHYLWCQNHTVALMYKKEDIDKHLRLATEYFSS